MLVRQLIKFLVSSAEITFRSAFRRHSGARLRAKRIAGATNKLQVATSLFVTCRLACQWLSIARASH